MKFAVAAGVLAQTLPALSEHHSRHLLSSEDDEVRIGNVLRVAREGGVSRANNIQHRNKRRTLVEKYTLDGQNTAFKNPPAALAFFAMEQASCDPTSTDADVGILSCDEGHFCKPNLGSKLGGLCSWEGFSKEESPRKHAFGKSGAFRMRRQQVKKQDKVGVPCDPASADIGILACGTGEFCKGDKSSELGGFCVSTGTSTSTASRHLYSVDKCDPSSTIYNSACDCSGLVNGTGTMTCVYAEEYVFCEDVNAYVTADYIFEESVEQVYKFCYEFSAPYYQKMCLAYRNAGTTCSIEFNGKNCSTCTLDEEFSISSFDCSNVEGGGIGGVDYYLVDLLPILGRCSDVNITFDCTLCNEGDYIPYVKYGVNVSLPNLQLTCQDLALGESLNLIPDYKCPSFSMAAQNGCCVYQCDLCGPDGYIPVTKFDIPIEIPVEGYASYSCGDFAYAAYVNFSIPDGTCAPIGGLIQESCCLADGCSICGGEMAYPSANVTLGGEEFPCYSLDTLLNSTYCELATPIAAPICCGETSSPSGAPSSIESTLPSMPTVADETTLAPTVTADATMFLSTKSYMSSLGLAVAAAILVSTS